MRFILSGMATKESEAAVPPTAEQFAAMHPRPTVLLGRGKRFFAEGTPARSFELVSTQATASGVILNTYRAAGPLKPA